MIVTNQFEQVVKNRMEFLSGLSFAKNVLLTSPEPIEDDVENSFLILIMKDSSGNNTGIEVTLKIPYSVMYQDFPEAEQELAKTHDGLKQLVSVWGEAADKVFDAQIEEFFGPNRTETSKEGE